MARNLHKLMAYKDEYEVARLMLLPEADAAAAEAGTGQRSFLLHPPVLKALGRARQGPLRRPQPARCSRAWPRGKRLRGTRLDPFGATEVRRTERALVGEYVGLVRLLVDGPHRRPRTPGRSRSPGWRTASAATRTSRSAGSRSTARRVAEAVAGWPGARG